MGEKAGGGAQPDRTVGRALWIMAAMIERLAPGLLPRISQLVQQGDGHVTALRQQVEFLLTIRPAGFKDGTILDVAYSGNPSCFAPRRLSSSSTLAPSSSLSPPVLPPDRAGAVPAVAGSSTASTPAVPVEVIGDVNPEKDAVSSPADDPNQFAGVGLEGEPFDALSPKEKKDILKEHKRLERNRQAKIKRDAERVAKAEKKLKAKIKRDAERAAKEADGAARLGAQPQASSPGASSSETSSWGRKRQRSIDPISTDGSSCSCTIQPCAKHSPTYRSR